MGKWKYNFISLDIGTSGGRVISFTSRPLTPGELALGIHWIPGLVCTRTGLENVDEISFPYRDSKPIPSAVQSIASRYTRCAVTAPNTSRISKQKEEFYHRRNKYQL